MCVKINNKTGPSDKDKKIVSKLAVFALFSQHTILL